MKKNPFGATYINSSELTRTDIPALASDWRELIEFAARIDLANEKPSIHIRNVAELTDSWTIVDMWYALYAEWRRWNHFGHEPDAETIADAQRVLDAIREKLR